MSDLSTPDIVDRVAWQRKIDELRHRDKAHTREADAIAAAPSNRPGSSINSSRPAARTASLTVCQEAPSPVAILAIDIRLMTRHFSAHNTACRDSFARGAAAAEVSRRQIRSHPLHL